LERAEVEGVSHQRQHHSEESEEKVMLKLRVAAAVVAAALAATPTLAEQAQPPAAQVEQELVGLAVYSSDGEKLGQVTHVGTAGGQPAVRAELGGFLDIAPSAVVIPATMFEHKPDRIEVSMTAAEVKETLSKQQGQQQR
jgi:ribosomal 30S subunit maturation factor RimM